LMREKEQSQSSKVQTAISFGTAILGAFLGRKAVSASSAGRFGTAIRGASRIRKESMDVQRAQQTFEATKLELEELDQRLQADIERIEAAFDPDSESIREVLIKPKSSDITLEFFGLVWMPYRRDARGQLATDWQ
ncbi:MAG: ATP-binding protein, partial [Desulfobacterales bacterium]